MTEQHARRAGAIDALNIVERALEKHCEQQHPDYPYPHTAGDHKCARCVELLERTEEIGREIAGLP